MASLQVTDVFDKRTCYVGLGSGKTKYSTDEQISYPRPFHISLFVDGLLSSITWIDIRNWTLFDSLGNFAGLSMNKEKSKLYCNK